MGLFSPPVRFSDLCSGQLTLHEVGSRLQPPHDLAPLGAVHAAVLRVPDVGNARLVCENTLFRKRKRCYYNDLEADVKTPNQQMKLYTHQRSEEEKKKRETVLLLEIAQTKTRKEKKWDKKTDWRTFLVRNIN